MEPPPFGSGNSPCRWGCHPPRTAFNGATAFRQWKLCRRYAAPAAQTEAFNGATAFRQWKLGAFIGALNKTIDLQWSHRLSAVETGEGLEFKIALPRPSMEPPPFGSGNCHGTSQGGAPSEAFNGATAFRQWKPRGSAR